MRFNVVINQDRCLKNNLNVNQAALMSLLNELNSWADEKLIGGKIYWHISRNKVIQELPLFYSKADTVYRHFRDLNELKMIEYHTEKRKDYVRLTAKGKLWNKLGNESDFVLNSEMNPSKLGNESDFSKSSESADAVRVIAINSEMNPTDNIINNNTSDEREETALAFLERNSPSAWEVFQMQYRRKFSGAEWDKFQLLFNCKAIEEKLEFTSAIINARLVRFAVNYIPGIGQDQKQPTTETNNHPSRKKLG